jgi:capsular polysaccharide biosynthesis protein
VSASPPRLAQDAPTPWRLPHNVTRQAIGALAASRLGLRFFGHWMRDDLTTALVMQDWAPLVAPQHEPTGHQRDYLAATRLEITPCSVTHFDELFVVDQNNAENAFKRERLRELRQRLRGDHAVRPHAGVMLLRGSSGQTRRLVNEDALAESLQRRGIDVLDPTQLSAAEIVRRCAGAQVVIGVEGSQLSHGIVQLDDGASLLVIQPPQRFNNPLKAPCDALGARYGFVVGQLDGNSAMKERDFSVDVDAVHRLLDRMTAR